MDTSSIISYVAIGVSVATSIFGIINHKRIRSSCCGSLGEISLDIENTTPTNANLLSSPILDVPPSSNPIIPKDADIAR